MEKIQPIFHIFAALEQSCLDEGGDGDAMFLTSDWQKYANMFEEWLIETKNDWWTRRDELTFVSFDHDQESIWFCNDMSLCPWGMYVIQYEWVRDHTKRNI